MTGLNDFGRYLSRLLAVDALFLMKTGTCTILLSSMTDQVSITIVRYLTMAVRCCRIYRWTIRWERILLTLFLRSGRKH